MKKKNGDHCVVERKGRESLNEEVEWRTWDGGAQRVGNLNKEAVWRPFWRMDSACFESFCCGLLLCCFGDLPKQSLRYTKNRKRIAKERHYVMSKTTLKTYAQIRKKNIYIYIYQ